MELRKNVRPATVFNLTDVEKKELWSNLKTYLLALLIVLFLIVVDLYMFRAFDLKKEKVQLEDDIVLTNISEHFVDMNKTIQHNNETKLLLSNATVSKVNTTSVPNISATRC